MGDESLFDMSMGVEPHETHSYEAETNMEQSSLQHHGPPGPPCAISSRLVFQPVPEEPVSNGQDSREDESEEEGSNYVVIFTPDIEPSTPPHNP